jgi:stage III sporulation protein AA
MLYNLLPEWLYNEISKKYILEFVFEIRLRIGKPILVNFKGKYEILFSQDGYKKIPMIATNELVEYVLSVSTKQSLYAFNDQIKHCYISTDDGIRIGVCGRVVLSDGKVATIKNITSINIRISHQVLNCSEKVINFLYNNGVVKNTLIISPPGAGKTTFIRDLAYKFSNEKQIKNILIVDERYEIAGLGISSKLDVGDFSDIISGSDKHYAFDEALKTMSPSVIVTDEISTEDDLNSIKQAIKSGVSVIATAHAKCVEDLKFKKYFDLILKDKYFERIVVLSSRNGVGTIEGVFDENLRCIYLPYMI